MVRSLDCFSLSAVSAHLGQGRPRAERGEKAQPSAVPWPASLQLSHFLTGVSHPQFIKHIRVLIKMHNDGAPG